MKTTDARSTDTTSANPSLLQRSTSKLNPVFSQGRALLGLALVLSVATAACSDQDASSVSGPSERSEAVELDLSPKELELAPGDTYRFEATPRDEQGRPVSGYQILWWSSDPDVAPVDEDGDVVALDDGTVTVKASARPTHSNGHILENSAFVHSKGGNNLVVSISGETDELAVGDTARLTASVEDTLGDPVDKNVSWSSGDTDVATVDADGLVTGVVAGSTYIFAKVASVTDSVAVPVASSATSEGDSTSAGKEETSTGDDGSDDSDGSDPTETAPEMPANVSVSVSATTEDSAAVSTSWDASSGADSYRWEAGSNSGSWNASGSGLELTEVAFPAPKSDSDDDSWVCVWAVNEAGESEQGCDGYTIPATTSSDSDDGSGSDDGSSSDDGTSSDDGSGSSDDDGSGTDDGTDDGTSGSDGTSPNEPAGMTRITERSFDALVEDGWWDYSDESTNAIVQDGAAPESPSNVYRKTYPTDCGQSSSCGTLSGKSFTAENYTESYMDFSWKMSSNFQGHSSGVNKILYIAFDESGNNYRDKLIVNNHTTDQGQATLQVRTQNTIEGERNLTRNLGASGDAILTRGRWHRIQVHAVASDPGSRNGEVHVWLDGTKVIEYTDIGWIKAGETKRIFQFKFDPIWGGNDSSESIESNMYYDLDHFYGSGK